MWLRSSSLLKRTLPKVLCEAALVVVVALLVCARPALSAGACGKVQ